jgi:CHAT domain-containing protein
MSPVATRAALLAALFLCPAAPAFGQEDARSKELVDKLVAAKTDAERRALLGAESGAATVELRKHLMEQGHARRSKREYTLALAYYRSARAVAERAADEAGVAAAAQGVGSAYFYLSEFDLSLENHIDGLRRYEALGDRAGVGNSLTDIGLVHSWRGEHNLALDYYARALQIAEAAADKLGTARTLSNIGIAHYYLGDYDSALENYQRANKLAEELGSKEGMYITLSNIGNVHHQRGSYLRALESYRRSLLVSEQLGSKYHPSTLQSIGALHHEQMNYELALEFFGQARALFEQSGNKHSAALALVSIGAVHLRLGDYAQALAYSQEALEMAEGTGSKERIVDALVNIGVAHRGLGDHARALEYFRRALEATDGMGSKEGGVSVLNNISAVALDQGRHADALAAAERAAAAAREIGIDYRLWPALLRVGLAHKALGRHDEARRALEESVSVIEGMRAQVAGGERERQRFFEGKLWPYNALVELSAARKDWGAAFAWAERAKARVLLDVLQRGRVNVTGAMTAAERERERRVRSDLVALNNQIAQESRKAKPDGARQAELEARRQKARLAYEAFRTTLYAAHPELKVERGEVSPVSVEEAGALLPDAQSALVEYVVSEDEAFLFVLTKAGAARAPAALKVYTLGARRADLDAKAEAFRLRLARRDLAYPAAARELYALLLAPAEAQLRGKTRLVVVPDGKLWELPFQALQDARGRHLVETYAISYAPSLTVLREAGAAPPSLLAVGNPSLGAETAGGAAPADGRAQLTGSLGRLPPLPDAERQVKALAELYGQARSRVYTGESAREGRFKAEAGHFRVLQLATHGVLNDSSPMYSHVLLAREESGGAEDGLLEAWELMGLDLKADLVVLSACETARGRAAAGEGVIGLTWAIFVAGSPTTVVSQWKVEAASTTELMLEFHRQLRPGAGGANTPKDVALQRAAKKMLAGRQHRHPFYWAGFVVVGDAN